MKKFQKYILILSILIFFSNYNFCLSQEKPEPKDKIQKIKSALTILGTTVFVGDMLAGVYESWRNNPNHKFFILNDGFLDNYSLGVDKIGHLYTSYAFTHLGYNMYKWAGFSENTSIFMGTFMSTSSAVLIEISDSYDTWGFSFYDLGFNLAGIGYATLQLKLNNKILNSLNFKWIYYPVQRKLDRRFYLDYDGHIYALSFYPEELLPKKIAKFWPDFLALFVGYSTRGYNSPSPTIVRRQYYIGLDYNLKSLPGSTPAKSFLKNVFDLIHLPAPVLNFSEDGDSDLKFK